MFAQVSRTIASFLTTENVLHRTHTSLTDLDKIAMVAFLPLFWNATSFRSMTVKEMPW
jgi:hypothetical protein